MTRAASALWLVALASLLGAACDGTRGTLVVRHEPSEMPGGASAGGDGNLAIPYVPGSEVRWEARLDGPVDITLDAELFYLDVDLQDEADLDELRAQGRRYLCYLSAGSFESYRVDASAFPDHVRGKQLPNFSNEQWLDVRDPAVRQIMQRRVSALAAKGCSGVPPSSLDVHRADTGFELSTEDALDYARWLSERIHAAGMSAGLASSLTAELSGSYDFGLAIGCLSGDGCAKYAVLEESGKPVLHAEFGNAESAPGVCKSAEGLGFEPLVTDPGFSGETLQCRDIL